MSSEGRESLRRQSESNRRDLLVLIYRHLLEEGLCDAANSLNEELAWMDLDEFSVCENVDLSLILMDFQNFYQMRFHRKPKLTKKEDNTVNGKARRKSRKTSMRTNENPDICDHNQNINNDHQINQQVHEVGITIPRTLLANHDMKDLAFQMVREFVDPKSLPQLTFDDVIGHSEVKMALEDVAILPMLYPELLEQSGLNSSRTNCLLLSGPPGTGKTLLAKSVASSLKMPFLDLRPSSLSSKWRGDSEKLVRCAFELARHNAPSVVFLDEAESVLSGGRDREGIVGQKTGVINEHEAFRRCKSEFLVQLDGLTSISNSGEYRPILFLAATNSPSTIDPAIMRRFQRTFQVGLPTSEERILIMQRNLSNSPLSANVNFQELAGLTENCSGSDLAQISEEAKRILFRKLVEAKIRKKSTKQTKEITQDDILTAINRIKPVK